jgi:hypothetical protein
MPAVRTALPLLIAACLLPRTAHAGRSFYGWLYGTEVNPERGVELQTWIQDENDKYGTRDRETWLWWGVLVGVTDQFELAFPVELEWLDTTLPATPTQAAMTRTLFTFRRFGLEGRYRLTPPDPVEGGGGLSALLRGGIKRDVTARDEVRLEGDAVVAYEAGKVHALLDVGAVGDVTGSTSHIEVRPGAGISLAATSELRVGAEIYSELSLDSATESWASAGPDMSWTHGRFWISGAFGIGLYHVKIASRVMWGIAF